MLARSENYHETRVRAAARVAAAELEYQRLYDESAAALVLLRAEYDAAYEAHMEASLDTVPHRGYPGRAFRKPIRPFLVRLNTAEAALRAVEEPIENAYRELRWARQWMERIAPKPRVIHDYDCLDYTEEREKREEIIEEKRIELENEMRRPWP